MPWRTVRIHIADLDKLDKSRQAARQRNRHAGRQGTRPKVDAFIAFDTAPQ